MKQIGQRILSALGLIWPARYAWMFIRRLGPSKPLVPEQAFYASVCAAINVLLEREPATQFGDYLEFGVNRGTSMACVYKALVSKELPHVRLIGFDSFQGLPPEAAEEGWVPGDFKSSLQATRAYLSSMDVDMQRITLVEGWFSQTCTEETKIRLSLKKASLIMVDCDIYSASRDVLRYVEPLIQDCAIVICDDWGARTGYEQRGQSDAFEEFLKEHPLLSAQPLPSYGPLSRVFLVSRHAL